jgi:hypothetical protein
MNKEMAEAGTRDSALRWGGVRDARHTHARERPASGRDSGRALGYDSGREATEGNGKWSVQNFLGYVQESEGWNLGTNNMQLIVMMSITY